MTLSLNVPKTIGSSTSTINTGEYLATGSHSGVFIDVAPQTFGAIGSPHSGVAFFCDGVPSGAPDNQAWTGQARGVTFWPNMDIKVEDWLGGADNQKSEFIGKWQYGVIYRVTATYTASNVHLAVYKTDNADNVVALVASATRSTPSSGKGTDACVFATPGCVIGCTPNALHI